MPGTRVQVVVMADLTAPGPDDGQALSVVVPGAERIVQRSERDCLLQALLLGHTRAR